MEHTEITFEEMVYAKYFEKKQQLLAQLRIKVNLLKRLLDSADLEDDNELESVIAQIHGVGMSRNSNNGKIFEEAVLESIQDLYGNKLAVLYQVHMDSVSRDAIDIVLTDFNNCYKLDTKNKKDGEKMYKTVIKDRSKCFFISLKTTLETHQLKQDTEMCKGFPFYCMLSMNFGKKGYGKYNGFYENIASKDRFNSIISCKNKLILLPTDSIPKDDKRVENHISDWDTLPLLIEVFRMEVLKQDILADEDDKVKESDVVNHTKIEVQVEESDRNDTETEAEVETDYESENESDCC